MYIGSTNNLRKRLEMHNSGKIYSTKLRKPFNLVYYESYKSEKDARKREHNLKLRSRAFAQLMKRIQESLE
ncbi:GIY-YIG nuclease superfamily protein [bacterium BMS3Abin15]|nr:GIY-YIG nuclease superfamily protein [bacterium BMS3Abin15]